MTHRSVMVAQFLTELLALKMPSEARRLVFVGFVDTLRVGERSLRNASRIVADRIIQR